MQKHLCCPLVANARSSKKCLKSPIGPDLPYLDARWGGERAANYGMLGIWTLNIWSFVPERCFYPVFCDVPNTGRIPPNLQNPRGEGSCS